MISIPDREPGLLKFTGLRVYKRSGSWLYIGPTIGKLTNAQKQFEMKRSYGSIRWNVGSLELRCRTADGSIQLSACEAERR
jgi:hypothetical protein